MWPQILHNFYMRPSYKKPYYFIHNINKSVEDAYNNSSAIHYNNPTNPISTDASSLTSIRINGTDSVGELTNTINNGSITINNESTFLPRNMVVTDVNDNEVIDSSVEKSAGHRYGNSSNVRLEIRYGKDNSVFELDSIWIDYLKVPQHIRLTQE